MSAHLVVKGGELGLGVWLTTRRGGDPPPQSLESPTQLHERTPTHVFGVCEYAYVIGLHGFVAGVVAPGG